MPLDAEISSWGAVLCFLRVERILSADSRVLFILFDGRMTVSSPAAALGESREYLQRMQKKISVNGEHVRAYAHKPTR